jgi:hypothetical protein
VGSAVLYVFGLFVLYLALPFGYATWRVRQVDQGWASSFESRQAFAAHLPKTATSAGAWQLHELTRPLGIDMVGETARSGRLDAIGAFAMAQQRAPDDAPRTAPAEVTQFLDEHARHLGAIETDLLEGSALSWERDLEAGFDAPQPDFRGHRYLQCMAGYSERMRMTAELLRENDDPCTLDLRAMSRAAEDALPHWNWLARSVIKDAPLAWDVLTVVRLDGEFTRLVMEARRDSGNIKGSSPIVSTVCKSVSWIRTAGRDGTATIAAQPPRPLRYETGSRHWTFTLGPAS